MVPVASTQLVPSYQIGLPRVVSINQDSTNKAIVPTHNFAILLNDGILLNDSVLVNDGINSAILVNDGINFAILVNDGINE